MPTRTQSRRRFFAGTGRTIGPGPGGRRSPARCWAVGCPPLKTESVARVGAVGAEGPAAVARSGARGARRWPRPGSARRTGPPARSWRRPARRSSRRRAGSRAPSRRRGRRRARRRPAARSPRADDLPRSSSGLPTGPRRPTWISTSRKASTRSVRPAVRVAGAVAAADAGARADVGQLRHRLARAGLDERGEVDDASVRPQASTVSSRGVWVAGIRYQTVRRNESGAEARHDAGDRAWPRPARRSPGARSGRR